MANRKTTKSATEGPVPAPMPIEFVDVDALSADPANARKHGPKNLESIKSSLRRFGQVKPIVVDGNDVVRAGNGTLEAARALGWKQIQVVRSHLAGSEMTAFAIADNRTAELAEWDADVLAAELGGLKEDGIDLSDLGFDVKDVAKLIGEELPRDEAAAGDEKWMIVLTCRDEAHQAEMLGRFAAEGVDCRAMNG